MISSLFIMSRKAVKYVLIKVIHLYQLVLSPDKGFLRFLYPIRGACVMYPTCSEYMVLSVEKHGALKGFIKGIRRIGRCHPYQKKLVDLP